MNTILSAFSARHVRLSHAPRAAAETATAPGEPSPIAARAPQVHFNWESFSKLLGRSIVVVVGWALLGIYCGMVFFAFRGH
jgi:hypothetical protein